LTRLRPYLMVLPAMVGIITFVIYPMLYLIYLSLFKYNLMNKAKSTFIGLENYTEVFMREDFYKALGNTFVYTIGAVGLTMVISLLFALWLSKRSKLAYSRRISSPLSRLPWCGFG
jgi:sn-glycerol 3-phosphate transport system permease protein